MPEIKRLTADFQPGLSHPYYFIRSGLFKKIKQYAPDLKGDLLDFGCGSKPYKALFTHCKSYIGIDFENPGHSHVNEEIDFYYDGRNLPFENDKFDSIFASEVFEHLFNLPELLPELNRVLKSGGRLLVTCPFVWPEHEKPFDYARYTLFALKSELEKYGFRILSLDKSGSYYTALAQLKVAYIHDILLGKLSLNNRIPFLANLARKTLVPVINLYYKMVSKILPLNKNLYLNNIVLAEKK